MDLVDPIESPQWALPSLEHLVHHLVEAFDEVIGPVVHDGVIRLRPITTAGELPVEVTDEQEAATYRLRTTSGLRRFGYGPGPDSLKTLVHPPRTPVWTMRRRDGSIIVEQADHPVSRRAVLGVRACDLRALAILERTQTGGPHPDPAFLAHRAGLFLVVVDCEHPAPTCFCDTANGGPTATSGYDLALTELDGPHGPTYIVRAGTGAGERLVESLRLEPADPEHVRIAERLRAQCEHEHIRELPDHAAAAVRQPDHPRWAEVAERCLTCGNCTAVCPTCFCTDMDDEMGLDGVTSTRTRVWDTCFSMEYSHLGPGPHRSTPVSRYRQWLSHKLGTWHDQFGESGCVGCGRCITWCPVGIDLTAEVEALALEVAT
jgi:ferredoxin